MSSSKRQTSTTIIVLVIAISVTIGTFYFIGNNFAFAKHKLSQAIGQANNNSQNLNCDAHSGSGTSGTITTQCINNNVNSITDTGSNTAQ